MSSVGANSSLLVAGLDLSLVRLLRQAIRTADLSSTATAGAGHFVADNSPREAAIRTIVRTERESTPAATFEPTVKQHLHPRLGELQPYTCSRPVLPADAKSTIQPPWKVLPWPVKIRPVLPPGHRVIKVQGNYTEVDSVGRTLDLFV